MYPQALKSIQKTGQSNQSSDLGVRPARSSVAFQPVHIEVRPIPDSQALAPNNVWLSLYAAMLHFAWANKRPILTHTVDIRPRSVDVIMRLIANVDPDGPRRSPPFLQYWMIIGVLGQVAE